MECQLKPQGTIFLIFRLITDYKPATPGILHNVARYAARCTLAAGPVACKFLRLTYHAIELIQLPKFDV